MEERPSAIGPDGLFDGLQWSSILRGAVLDIAITFVVTLPVLLWMAGEEAVSEDEAATRQAFDQVLVSPEYLWFAFFAGLSATVYACFWCARRAGTQHLRHGGWTAIVSALIGALFLLLPGEAGGVRPPLWYDALGLLLMLPAGLLGGWLAARVGDPES